MFRSFLVLLVALCTGGLGHARNEGVTADEIRLGASAVLSGAPGPPLRRMGGARGSCSTRGMRRAACMAA
ncbi:hypothetical protein [Acidovorax sp. SD340]|uniref:hypothetical protein n=1 Tax=Acidovorax sp. SD340 TaxID=1690268 RepID=UPI001EE46F3C|nr:hypothetical protein [Acidovorax sp. SD340]